MALPLVGSSPYGPAPSLPLSHLPLSLSTSTYLSLSSSPVLMPLIRPLEEEFIAPPPFPLHSSMRVVLLVRGCRLTDHTPYW